jgi:hypothetical protein
MYTIIGGDGKEYGPVSADQVRAWVAGARANLKTKVKLVGSDTWITVADIPEISAEPGTPGTPAAAPEKKSLKGTIIASYVCSVLSIFIFPIPLGLAGFALGVYNLTKGAVAHGVCQIIISGLCGCIGTLIGIAAVMKG